MSVNPWSEANLIENQSVEDFQATCGFKVRRNISGSGVTTMAIGGALACLIEPDSVSQARQAMLWLKANSKAYRVLGAGSNLLIPESGLSDWIFRLGRGFREYSLGKRGGSKVEITVGGAMPLMTLSREVSALGLSGLEFAGGIPASLGGAVYMNAGAHGNEMSDIIGEVTVLLPTGEIQVLTQSELKFSYRHSTLPFKSMVLSAKLNLIEGDRNQVAARRGSFLKERKERQPLNLPSSGSVFKNPLPNRSAGMVLEEAGMKGFRLGGAQVSELHANWIVNPTRQATSTDVLGLIKVCQGRASEKFGIELQPELVVW